MKSLYLCVYLMLENEKIKVGELAEVKHTIYFEYAPEFISRGIEISPFKLPLMSGVQIDQDKTFGGLPGVFYDSLPDGWGLLLMDRHFRKHGIDPFKASLLERLAFIGDRAMGALTYEPALPLTFKWTEGINLETLAADCEHILQGHEDDILPELIILGGSPGGARPKILIGYDKKSKTITSDINKKSDTFVPYLVKFSVMLDYKDAAEIEFAYATMAVDCGINMPEHLLFNVGRYGKAFAVRRFDRNINQRIHMHTLSALLHADFRIPNLDYTDFLKATWILTQDMQQIIEAYRRMVFNVLFHNRDDHSKNFSFILDHLTWSLSPAYDLTFSTGVAGEHTMTIAGVGAHPMKTDLLKVAQKNHISKELANQIIEQVLEVRDQWPRYAQQAKVSKTTVKQLTNIFNRIVI